VIITEKPELAENLQLKTAIIIIIKARTEWFNGTELTRFSFWQTDQWAKSNALQ